MIPETVAVLVGALREEYCISLPNGSKSAVLELAGAPIDLLAFERRRVYDQMQHQANVYDKR
ncbi:hypothetical protein J6590_030287 [Homalodisca vitripennis]|nr:hypothetical protein J6590_030287 [Homalodisca vitripennis]